MLIYAENKADFLHHINNNLILSKINSNMEQKLLRRVGAAEQRSWQNSLQFMGNILRDGEIPEDCGIAIEYAIPQSSQRVDFIISGYDGDNKGNLIVVELKQWERAKVGSLDAHVDLGSYGQKLHPSYQAWSYSAYMEDYNATIQEEQISLHPCAYLHNFKDSETNPVIKHPFYDHYLKDAPAFLMDESDKLRGFIKRYIKYGDSKAMLYHIEAGKIRPSKNLADALVGMMEHKPEFILLEEQKTAYETALNLADAASKKSKKVLIVRGGPGTGKTVVAMNLLVELTKREKVVQYVSSNAAPREVYAAKLTGKMYKNRISNMFKGATIYQKTPDSEIDVLVVDEAHRLSARNIMNTYQGNQVMDLIHASKLCVFFLDETQKILIEDIGSEAEILKQARDMKAQVTIVDLPSQFRCNGSDGYLAWLDHTLGIRETANTTLANIDYDFKIFDDPQRLHDEIIAKNIASGRDSGARLVAGYCWPWKSKKDPLEMDITIGNYSAQWNKFEDRGLWAIRKGSEAQVGCIHTVQGLEFDYIGVIIGNDLGVDEEGKLITKPLNRDHVDANKTLRGLKSTLKSKNQEEIQKITKLADQIVKDTYKVLMTKGQKGCYIYCTDPQVRDYFIKHMGDSPLQPERNPVWKVAEK